MKLLQIKVDDKLKKAIDTKSEIYGVPSTSLIRIVLVKTFLNAKEGAFEQGNVFNADRDADGKGIGIDEMIGLI